jgi:hypothetical protein
MLYLPKKDEKLVLADKYYTIILTSVAIAVQYNNAPSQDEIMSLARISHIILVAINAL